MKQIKGTQTEKNLLTAFAGESQARNRYTYFASQAKKEGFEKISAIFLETADQEKEHAKRLFKFLEGGEAEVSASFPAGKISNTAENLTAAANGEHYENTIMYPGFADVADKEDFTDIANTFRAIVVAEQHHEKRYRALRATIDQSTTFKKKESIQWTCRNCGYVHTGADAPELCPACLHPQAYYEPLCECF